VHQTEDQEKLVSINIRIHLTLGQKARKFIEYEDAVYERVLDYRSDGLGVDYKRIRLILKDEIFRQHPETNQEQLLFQISGFSTFSAIWMCVRRKTTNKIPNDRWIELATAFRKEVEVVKRDLEVIDICVFNMDETSVWFDMNPSMTIDTRGISQVRILTTKESKTRCTISLTVSSTGKKLRPFIIFKVIRRPTRFTAPENLDICFQ
jgi:hypothetical protein